MRQKIFHIAACGSFLLCVVAGVAWGRSYWRQDLWVMNSSGIQRVSHSQSGYLSFSRVHAQDAGGNSVLEDRQWEWESRPAEGRSSFRYGITPWQRVLGLGGRQVNLSGKSAAGVISTNARMWWVAYRWVALCSAVLPAIMIGKRVRIAWKSRVRLARQSKGLCETCGYDLRATAGKCPECGTIATGGTPTAA
jgi:hypothetical protein